MKINLDCIIFGLQKQGGISNYWARLIQYINSLDEVGCSLLMPKRVKYEGNILPTNPHFDISVERSPLFFARYMKAKVSNKSDIFHSSYYRLPNSPVKSVVTVHDFIYERYGRGIRKWAHEFQKHQSIGRANAIIAISESTKNDLLTYCKNINPSQIYVIHHGVDHNSFFPDPNDGWSEFGIDSAILYIGQRSGHKRFDLAVDALKTFGNLKLGIVGPLLTSKEVNFLNASIHGRWFHFGSVQTPTLRKIYSSVFALIYPSEYEGFGLPILEAMACGCPVIAAYTSSLPEVGGDACLYAVDQTPEAYASAIHDLINNATLRNQLIKSGLRRAAEFTWKRTFEKTIRVYQSLLCQ
jgi:mannosyltransferase